MPQLFHCPPTVTEWQLANPQRAPGAEGMAQQADGWETMSSDVLG